VGQPLEKAIIDRRLEWAQAAKYGNRRFLRDLNTKSDNFCKGVSALTCRLCLTCLTTPERTRPAFWMDYVRAAPAPASH
jgi:hypothetical protein